jgi:hypothetical protein
MIWLLVACATPEPEPIDAQTVDDCLTHYAVDNGWAYDDDQDWQYNSKAPSMIVEYYCEFDDRACEEDNVLPREAAACVAEVSGMGGEVFGLELNYRGPDNTLIWVVESVTYGTPYVTPQFGGDQYEVDAWNDNDVLVQSTWSEADCFS